MLVIFFTKIKYQTYAVYINADQMLISPSVNKTLCSPTSYGKVVYY